MLSAAMRTSRLVLVLDGRGDLVDLLLLEEIERGVELLEVDDALRPRRRLLRGRRLAIARGGLGAPGRSPA